MKRLLFFIFLAGCTPTLHKVQPAEIPFRAMTTPEGLHIVVPTTTMKRGVSLQWKDGQPLWLVVPKKGACVTDGEILTIQR